MSGKAELAALKLYEQASTSAARTALRSLSPWQLANKLPKKQGKPTKARSTAFFGFSRCRDHFFFFVTRGRVIKLGIRTVSFDPGFRSAKTVLFVLFCPRRHIWSIDGRWTEQQSSREPKAFPAVDCRTCRFQSHNTWFQTSSLPTYIVVNLTNRPLGVRIVSLDGHLSVT